MAAVVLLAGCGRAPDPSAAVLRGVARSPLSYLFYGRVWWGRDPHIRVLALHVRGRRAFVVLAASGVDDEHLELVLGRRRRAWRVVSIDGGLVTGPFARRPATHAERDAIAWPCVRSTIYVSRIDAGWAVIRPHCTGDSGMVLMERTGARWDDVDEESSFAFYCREAPPGVIRGLVGACATSR